MAEVITGREQQRHDDHLPAGGGDGLGRGRSGVLEEGCPHFDAGGQRADPPGERPYGLLGLGGAAAVGDREQHRTAHAAPRASRPSASRSLTTSPTTTTAGGRTPRAAASSATCPSVDTITPCRSL